MSQAIKSEPIMYLEIFPIHIPVKIIKTRMAYGRQDMLITPIGGSGRQWVCSSRVINSKTLTNGEETC